MQGPAWQLERERHEPTLAGASVLFDYAPVGRRKKRTTGPE